MTSPAEPCNTFLFNLIDLSDIVQSTNFDGWVSAQEVNGQNVSCEGKMKRRKTMNMEEEASSTSWT